MAPGEKSATAYRTPPDSGARPALAVAVTGGDPALPARLAVQPASYPAAAPGRVQLPDPAVLTAAFDTLGIGLIVFDSTLSIIAANQHAGSLIRVSENLRDVLHRADFSPPQDWAAVIRGVLETRHSRQFDALCVRSLASVDPRYYKLSIVSLAAAAATTGGAPIVPPVLRGEAGGVVLADQTSPPGLIAGADSETAAVPAGLLTIEEVTQRIGVEQRLAVSERLAALGQLAARVAHELNNPLDGILRYVGLCRRVATETGNDRLDGYLGQINTGLLRMAQIVRSLLEYARGGYAGPNAATLESLIDEAIRTYQRPAEAQGVNFVCSYEPQTDTLPGATHLFQVFCNLIKNAVDAMPRGGILAVRTRRSASGWTITFEDGGVGLPEEIDRIFEPFFTTKPPGAGTGLGLAVCRELLEKLGGRITAARRPEGGSIFTVQLPAAMSTAAAPPFVTRQSESPP